MGSKWRAGRGQEPPVAGFSAVSSVFARHQRPRFPTGTPCQFGSASLHDTPGAAGHSPQRATRQPLMANPPISG